MVPKTTISTSEAGYQGHLARMSATTHQQRVRAAKKAARERWKRYRAKKAAAEQTQAQVTT